MNRLLPEDLFTFKKNFPEAVKFLREAHKRHAEYIKLKKQKEKDDELKYAKSIFQINLSKRRPQIKISDKGILFK
uniref:Uncharacterized protein n=1 Tax=viral metagenome TaxID=1070528 RepID=A0A6M3J025_9ZZZZ